MEYISQSKAYFETGVGGSTRCACMVLEEQKRQGRTRLAHISANEADPDWIKVLKAEPLIQSCASTIDFTFNHLDIGETGNYSYPKGCDGLNANCDHLHNSWKLYSGYIMQGSVLWDLVMVDARFRVNCMLNTISYFQFNHDRYASLGPDFKPKVMIHDFERQEYQIIRKYADMVERVGNLAVFTAKAFIDVDALTADIAAHAADMI